MSGSKSFGPDTDFPKLTEPSGKPMLRSGYASEVPIRFIELSDTPSSYVGQQGKAVIVSSSESSVYFVDFDHSTLANTHNLPTDIDHDQLDNYVVEQHIRWDLSGVEQINSDRIPDVSAPDDDFYNELTLVTSIQDADQLLIADASDSFNYKRISKATFVTDLGAVQNGYYRIIADSGTANLDADGEDAIYIKGDGEVFSTVGDATGVNELNFTLFQQPRNYVLAGPSSGTDLVPTFRELLDDDMPSSYAWVNWNYAYNWVLSWDGGSYDITYSNATPMPEDVGGAEEGSTFDEQTMSEMFNTILYPYQYPSFTSFSIQSQTQVLEVGNSIPADGTFIWGTNNDDNINDDSISIIDEDAVGGEVVIDSGLSNTGSVAVTYPAIIKTEIATHTFRIEGINSQSGTFDRSYTYHWRWKMFYGESSLTTLAEGGVESLRASRLDTGFAYTYAYDGGGYKYIAYPQAWGKATTFTDASTMLSAPFEDAYTVTITNTFGQSTDYWVHRSTNILTGAVDIIVS